MHTRLSSKQLSWYSPLLFLLLFIALSIPQSATSQDIPSRPSGFVNDYAGMLSSSERSQLERKLRNYRDSTSNEVAIATVKSLQGYAIDEFSLKMAEAWNIGTEDNQNGILILVSRDDRKMRIEVGYGLEGAIPDALAGQIVNRIMKPAFRDRNFHGGFDKATDAIMRAAAGEYEAVEQASKNSEEGWPSYIIFVLFALFVIWGIYGKRKGGGKGGGRGGSRRRRNRAHTLHSGGIIIGGFGGGSSGGFSSGGGGFGGFSGGGGFGFGGGGASGSW